jgi:hypothetical protein
MRVYTSNRYVVGAYYQESGNNEFYATSADGAGSESQNINVNSRSFAPTHTTAMHSHKTPQFPYYYEFGCCILMTPPYL